MENIVHTIVCPNCGASSSNLRNCEYCGSFLVQFAGKGEEMKDYVEHAKLFHYAGLEKVVQKYFEIHQELFDLNIYDRRLTAFGERLKGAAHKDLVSLLNLEIRDSKNEPRITLCRVGDGCGIKLSPTSVPYASFKNSRSFSLFTKNNILDEYVVSFGRDFKGASSLVLQLLDEVFDIPFEDITYFVYSPFDEIWSGYIHWALFNNNGDCIECSRKGENEFNSFADYMAKEIEKTEAKIAMTKKEEKKKGCAGMLAFLVAVGAGSTYGLIELIKSIFA